MGPMVRAGADGVSALADWSGRQGSVVKGHHPREYLLSGLTRFRRPSTTGDNVDVIELHESLKLTA